ncbi:hypothetical protein ACMD2_10325 [Ananas comosus]|uniref:Uncharacterized protein n=1 Tax=Ananas comosus TaxID=4615 RepID=A0A199UD61_ANACO|nr:hypothetical protein ACMD2_10325 [Ananas comosus]
MAEIVAASAAAYSPCQNRFPLILRGGRSTNPTNAIAMKWGKKNYKNNAMRNTHSMILPAAVAAEGMIVSKENKKPPADIVTFSSNISTDLPLYEHPGAGLFYSTLFSYFIPPLFPSIYSSHLREFPCSKSQGKEYPSSVPRNITSVLELQATRWELQGLDSTYMPSYFALSVQGMLYPEQKGGRRRLKGELEMSFSFVLPPVLALVPENVLRGVAESVLRRLVEKMKRDVDAGLIEDFRRFQRERLI